MAKASCAQRRLASGERILLMDLALIGYRPGQWVRALDRVTDWTPGRIGEVMNLGAHGLLETDKRADGTLIYRLTTEGSRTADQLIVDCYCNAHPDLAQAAARRLAEAEKSDRDKAIQ